jgi:holo-[acyl-carrier protein] synthase
MIRGLGVDIIEIARIRELVETEGTRFLERVFTQEEIVYCNGKPRRYQHFAARFAAKEAVSKALASGWAGEFRWKDVQVTNDPSGRPGVTLHGPLREQLGRGIILLSLSHSDTNVVAVALIEDRET